MMASEKTKCFLSQKDLDIIIHVFKIFQVELRSGLIASEVDDKNIFLLYRGGICLFLESYESHENARTESHRVGGCREL